MKTTVDIPDALYRQAKIRAAELVTTLRALLVHSLESLIRHASNAETLPRRQRFEVDEQGWSVLKRAHGDTTVITDELVNRLPELEGV